LLKRYVSDVVAISKDTKGVLDSIEQERQNTAQEARDVEKFYTAVGVFLGATAQNNRSLTENAQDGETAGVIAGKIGASIINSVPSSTFDGELARCQTNLAIMAMEATRLFLEAVNLEIPACLLMT